MFILLLKCVKISKKDNLFLFFLLGWGQGVGYQWFLLEVSCLCWSNPTYKRVKRSKKYYDLPFSYVRGINVLTSWISMRLCRTLLFCIMHLLQKNSWTSFRMMLLELIFWNCRLYLFFLVYRFSL